MLLNKRKRNPGQNLMNNWVRVNNVCEPAPKSMFCPPPPQGIQRTPEVCFEFPSNLIGKSVIVKSFLTGQSWQVNKSRGTQVEPNKDLALSHRPRGH